MTVRSNRTDEGVEHVLGPVVLRQKHARIRLAGLKYGQCARGFEQRCAAAQRQDRLAMAILILDELDYLAEWVELPRFLPKQGVLTEEIGLGRNCILFDFLRKWAYKAVRQERAERSFSTWKKRVEERALARNADFRDPMHFQEVGHIAKSVAKWVWTQDPKAEQRFKQTQAYRGRKSGEARLLASEDKRSSARLMAAFGSRTNARRAA